MLEFRERTGSHSPESVEMLKLFKSASIWVGMTQVWDITKCKVRRYP